MRVTQRGLDLTEAIEAARDAMDEWETFQASDGHRSIRPKARHATPAEVVAAVTPLIEAAARAAERAKVAALEAEAAALRDIRDIATDVIRLAWGGPTYGHGEAWRVSQRQMARLRGAVGRANRPALVGDCRCGEPMWKHALGDDATKLDIPGRCSGFTAPDGGE